MRILFIVLAFIIAAATAWWVSGQLQREEIVQTKIEKKVVRESSRGVLVAAETIPAGTIIQEGDLTFRSWPESSVNANKSFIINDGSVTPASLIGSVAREDLIEGLPINNRLLIKPGAQGFLAAVLKPGMRAISIPVDERTGVSNLVVPGDLIDLILTSVFSEEVYAPTPGGELRRNENEVRTSETIAKNVRVLAVGSFLSKPEDRSRADNEEAASQDVSQAETITVEVPPKLAEAVVLGLQMGEINVAVTPLAFENEELEAADLDDPASIIKSVVDENYTSSTVDTEVSRTLDNRQSSSEGTGNSVTVSRGGKTKKSEIVGVIQREKPENN